MLINILSHGRRSHAGPSGKGERHKSVQAMIANAKLTIIALCICCDSATIETSLREYGDGAGACLSLAEVKWPLGLGMRLRCRLRAEHNPPPERRICSHE